MLMFNTGAKVKVVCYHTQVREFRFLRGSCVAKVCQFQRGGFPRRGPVAGVEPIPGSSRQSAVKLALSYFGCGALQGLPLGLFGRLF